MISELWRIIKSCIFGYLIKYGYFNLNEKEYINQPFFIDENWQKDEYIELRNLGSGSSRVDLYYHIKKRYLYAIKKIQQNNSKIFEREIFNYQNINHPLIPKLFGIVKNCNFLLIQFIDGQTLLDIQKFHFDINEKTNLIFQILCIFYYLHKNNFVYRDLKPNNIMIDKNKNIFLIDYDEMVKYPDERDISLRTKDFNSPFVDQEIFNGIISFENDIYSIGIMIYYFISEDYPQHLIKKRIDINVFQIIYEACIQNLSKRPSILELIFVFYVIFFPDINNFSTILDNECISLMLYFEKEYYLKSINFSIRSENKIMVELNRISVYYVFLIGSIFENILSIINDAKNGITDAQHDLGFFFYDNLLIPQNINMSIYYFTLAANNNDQDSQYKLGNIFYNGIYVERNINKSIYYYTLAANQNHSKAQYKLGMIYYYAKYVKFDIKKSIYYYTLATNQNYSNAQYDLGIIYLEGKYIKQDIKKGIQFLISAANQNDKYAQYDLGEIYYDSKYIKQDIYKSIHYFTLAANNNHAMAQNNLGYIYLYRNDLIKCDVNKAIYYITLASNNNCVKAQYHLGMIYSEGKFVKKDINKAIYYYKLAACQNDCASQNNLGIIYITGNGIVRDINQSIYYFSLAANHNIPHPQFNLGLVYFDSKNSTYDIHKSIKYLTFAANQDFTDAQYYLGLIYSKKKYKMFDINKAIYYFTLAADKNNHNSQYELGIIYSNGKYIKRNINKAIHYFSLSAKNNNSKSQYELGIIYLSGVFVEKNMIKGIDYIIQSSLNDNVNAHFCVGYFYHEGKYINRDIKKSINHYKEASSFNNQYAKNNLGVIYKNGIDRIVEKQIGYAKELLNESITHFNNKVSMDNLSHIYIYEEENFDKPFNLLTKSLNLGFYPSSILLSILLIKEFRFNIAQIREVILQKQISNNSIDLILKIIEYLQLYDDEVFKKLYIKYKSIDYIFDFNKNPIASDKIFKKIEIQPNTTRAKNITSDFYCGLGIYK